MLRGFREKNTRFWLPKTREEINNSLLQFAGMGSKQE